MVPGAIMKLFSTPILKSVVTTLCIPLQQLRNNVFREAVEKDPGVCCQMSYLSLLVNLCFMSELKEYNTGHQKEDA